MRIAIKLLCCLSLAAPAMAALQATDEKAPQDLGQLFSGEKKPCDADIAAQKKKAAQVQATKNAVAEAGQITQEVKDKVAQDNAVEGLIKLGVIPADKPNPEAQKPQLGLQKPLGNCK